MPPPRPFAGACFVAEVCREAVAVVPFGGLVFEDYADGYMRRGGALYSSSRGPRSLRNLPSASDSRQGAPAQDVAGSSPPPASRRAAGGASWRGFYARHERLLTIGISALVAVAAIVGYTAFKPAPRPLSQEDIDAAVLYALENNVLPSPAAKAYEAVQRSVVRVQGLAAEKGRDANEAKDKESKDGKDKSKPQGRQIGRASGRERGCVVDVRD